MGGATPAADAQALDLVVSPGFAAWLAEQRLALALTTYRGGGLVLVGLDVEGRLASAKRAFDRTAGLCAHGRRLYLATRFQLWRLDDALRPGRTWEGHDRLYAPRLAWMTGALHAHDVAVDGKGGVVFVNTMFSCLALPSGGYSFLPLWRSPWISALAPEDRCH